MSPAEGDPFMGSPSVVSAARAPKMEIIHARRRQKAILKNYHPVHPLQYNRATLITITLREGENYQIVSPSSTDILEVNSKLEVQRVRKTPLV